MSTLSKIEKNTKKKNVTNKLIEKKEKNEKVLKYLNENKARKEREMNKNRWDKEKSDSKMVDWNSIGFTEDKQTKWSD